MKDEDKTKKQLMDELAAMHKKVAEFKASEAARNSRENALEELNDKLQTLIEALPDMVFFKDAGLRHLVVNKAAEEFTGKSKGEFLGKTNEELLPPEMAKACTNSDEEALRVGKPLRFDEESINKAGEKRFLDTIKAPLYDHDGDLLGLMGVSRDITERRRMADELRESEERYRRLVELSPDGIGVEVEGNIAFINPVGARMLGAASPEELLGKPIIDFVHPHYHDTIKERVRQIKKNGKRYAPVESRFIGLDGTVMDVEMADTLISYHGRPALQIMFRDITERKQFEMERERLVVELQGAFAKVNTLRGLLPICASCKKIRDDKGYWTQIEAYIRDHSAAEFSHGICPECSKKLYPGL